MPAEVNSAAQSTPVSIVGASPSHDILTTQMLLDIRLYRLLPQWKRHVVGVISIAVIVHGGMPETRNTIVYAHFLPYAEKKSSNSTTHAMTFA